VRTALSATCVVQGTGETVVGRGRVIKASELATTDATTLPNALTHEVRATRVVKRAEVEQWDRLDTERRRVETELETQKANLLREAAALRELAVETGRAEGYATYVAEVLRVKAKEAVLERAVQERVVALARLLAERLLNKSLELTPALVADLAESALAEVRGARKVKLFVCPSDEQYLVAELARLSLPAASLSLGHDTELRPGQLRIVTELGTFEADLGPRLSALCQALGAMTSP
jgi:flagellar biosynthesis/type III secretory pathway protein FliH